MQSHAVNARKKRVSQCSFKHNFKMSKVFQTFFTVMSFHLGRNAATSKLDPTLFNLLDKRWTRFAVHDSNYVTVRLAVWTFRNVFVGHLLLFLNNEIQDKISFPSFIKL